jgi:hypothetical protein
MLDGLSTAKVQFICEPTRLSEFCSNFTTL